jgi:Peptidase_C39 like family
MLKAIPLGRDVSRRPATGGDIRLLDLKPVLGVATDGCVLASAAMVCGFYGIAGVTQRGLAATCGVAFPPLGGVQLATMGKALQHYGLDAHVVGSMSVEMIRTSILAGHPILGGHAVEPQKTTGHAVVICGWFALPGRPALVAVADPNIAFPMLVDGATMAGSARNAILLRGRKQWRSS